MMSLAKIKKSDQVIVIAGKDKGKIGEVKKVLVSQNKVLVSGVNAVKKHVKPSENDAGGIVSKELPIDLSNVAYYDEESSSKSRIGIKTVDGKRVRFMKKTGKVLG